MWRLTKEQLAEVGSHLDAGIQSFDPLRSELLDHVISDIELRLEQGEDFQGIWADIKAEIPSNHLKNIETETMILLNKKLNPTAVMANISIGLLMLSSIFKIFHLMGAGYLLLAFMVCTSMTMIVGFVTNVRLYKAAKGRLLIAALTVILTLFTAHFVLKILHMPGANELMFLTTFAILVIFPATSYYFYQNKPQLKDHLLIKVLDSNDAILDKMVIVLVLFGISLNYQNLIAPDQYLVGTGFLLFTNILVGLQAYAWSWRYYVREADQEKRYSGWLFIVSTIALILFILPVISGFFNDGLRHFFVYGGYFIFAVISIFHYRVLSDVKLKKYMMLLSIVLLSYPLIKLGVALEWLEGPFLALTGSAIVKISIMAILLTFFLIFRKEKILRTLLILTITLMLLPF